MYMWEGARGVAAGTSLYNPNISIISRKNGLSGNSERGALYRELKKFGIETQELGKLSESALRQVISAIKDAYDGYGKSMQS